MASMMDKWDEVAQKAWDAIIEEVRRLKKEKGMTLDALAQLLGIKNRASVSMWLSGDREAKNTSFPNMLRYLERLGLDYADFFPERSATATIRRTGANSPAEIVEGDDLCSVPVLGAAGAGGAVEFFATEPETVIQVMAQYAVAGVVALHIEGDSMEPTIRKGSYVGVVPMEGKIIEGNIYLVDLPHLGRVVKRIRMRSDGRLELYSDNPKFEPRPLPDEGYEHIIVGRVVWIWQLC